MHPSPLIRGVTVTVKPVTALASSHHAHILCTCHTKSESMHLIQSVDNRLEYGIRNYCMLVATHHHPLPSHPTPCASTGALCIPIRNSPNTSTYHIHSRANQPILRSLLLSSDTSSASQPSTKYPCAESTSRQFSSDLCIQSTTDPVMWCTSCNTPCAVVSRTVFCSLPEDGVSLPYTEYICTQSTYLQST